MPYKDTDKQRKAMRKITREWRKRERAKLEFLRSHVEYREAEQKLRELADALQR